MPVRIRDQHPVGQHTTVANGDVQGGAEPHTGADEAVISDVDSFDNAILGPDGEFNLGVRCPDDIGKGTQNNGPSENLDMPGPYKGKMIPELGEMGFQKMAHIESLEVDVRFFQAIGAVISIQE
jgi:hypothetical protein